MEDDFMKKGSILACSITCAMVVGGVIAYFAMPEDLKYKIKNKMSNMLSMKSVCPCCNK